MLKIMALSAFWRLFADGKLTVVQENLLCNKVARQTGVIFL